MIDTVGKFALRRIAIAGSALLLALLAGAPAFAGEAAVDAVFKTGILKVAVYRDFFPYSDAKEGGIDVDLANALAERLGVKASVLPFDAGDNLNDDLRNMVWKGHYLGYGPADVMLHVPNDPGLARQNDKVLIFSPYQVEGVALAINPQRIPEWQGLEVFAHEKVAVDGGSFAAQIILGADGGRYLEHVVIERNIRAAIGQLTSGAVAAVMGTRAELEAGGASKPPYQMVELHLPGAPLRSWAVGLAVKNDRTELAERLKAAIQQMQADGSMSKIFSQHGVRNVQP